MKQLTGYTGEPSRPRPAGGGYDDHDRPGRRGGRQDDYGDTRRSTYDDDDDYGRRRGGGGGGPPRDPSRWSLMRTGVGMMFWSLLILGLVGLAAFGLGIFVSSVGRGDVGREFRDLMAGLAILSVVVGGACGLTYFIGACLSCTIPAESGGRGWALGVIVLMVAVVLVFVSEMVFAVGAGGGPGGPRFGPRMGGMNVDVLFGGMLALGLLRLALSFALSLCFFMMLRAAANYWGDRGLAGGFLAYLIVYWAAPIVAAVLAFLFIAAAAGGPGGPGPARDLAMLIPCGAIIYGLVMYVWLLTLFGKLRARIPVASAWRGRYREEY
jgi:hypothetical protein